MNVHFVEGQLLLEALQMNLNLFGVLSMNLHWLEVFLVNLH